MPKILKGMEKKFRLVLFLALLPASVFAQYRLPDAVIVSDFQGEVRNNLLRLTWFDSAQARGSVFIYRSGTPFGETINPAALERPVEIPHGVQYYIDEVEVPGTYYYFAASSDESGRQFLYFFPLYNSIAVTVDASSFYPLDTNLASQAVDDTGFDGFSVEASDNAVIVNFTLDAEGVATGEKVLLYRSASPVRTAADLLNAMMIQPDVSSPFVDHPAAGIPYYYAVIKESDLLRGKISIVPGFNASSVAVGLPANQNAPDLPAGPSRLAPIPSVTLTAAGYEVFDESVTNSPVIELDENAAKTLEGLIHTRSKAPEKREMEPRILDEDLEQSESGERYVLESIVRGSFLNKDWPACIYELSRFLSQPRSEAAFARARFYLGQCFYFLGREREAFFEFIMARNAYPSETADWINACITGLN